MAEIPKNHAIRVICFDIGGVLAKIVKTWSEALAYAGIEGTKPEVAGEPFARFENLDPYQAGAMPLGGYLSTLATHLGIETDRAIEVHNAILIEEYPGVLHLVQILKSKGLFTACLSNTNEPHFQLFLASGRFPAIEALDFHMASHEVRLNKPDPAIYRSFEEAANARGEEIVFFDDSPANVKAAQVRGWTALRIDPDADPAAEMTRALEDLGILHRTSPFLN